MPYAEWLPKQLPSWFRKENGEQLWAAVGEFLDAQRDQATQSALLGFPTEGALDTTLTPPRRTLPATDALDAQGWERQLDRGPGESDAVYAARLLGAWAAWRYGGSHYGILRALEIAGYDDMVIVQDNGRYTELTGTAGTTADITFGSLMTCLNRSNHPGWTFDDRTEFYSRCGIVFTADAVNLQTSEGHAILNAIVKGWKESKLVFVGSFVILAGILLGWPTGRTLGTEPPLGGNSVRIIPGDGSPAFVIGP